MKVAAYLVLFALCTFSPRARGEKTLVVRRKLPCGKWKLLILRELLAGASRFGELRRNLSGISEKMLSQHLRELESDGIIARKIYPEVPPKAASSERI
jgi:DNA-binding transcriptional ArsR family regulator